MYLKFDERRPELTPYGMTCELWQPSLMRRPDRHNEIEINYLVDGSITYLIHNKKIEIPQKKWVVFWGLVPHQIVNFNKNSPYFVVTIPFAQFLQWNMPDLFVDKVFRGEVLIAHSDGTPAYDQQMLNCWIRDLNSNKPELLDTAALEIQAKLRRLAVRSTESTQQVRKKDLPPINLVEQIAIYIAGNFTRSIKVADVANAVGLHPDYANTIFKRTFGFTISSYLIEQRVLYVQRQLSVTNDSITNIAYDAGFNSMGRFNAAFRKICKCTPRDYRKRIRAAR